MWSALSLALLPGLLSTEVVVSVRTLSMNQIDLFKDYSYLIIKTYPVQNKTLKKQLRKKYKYARTFCFELSKYIHLSLSVIILSIEK